MRYPEPIQTRLEKQLKQVGDCMLWSGRINNSGYGVISYQSRTLLVHRLTYSLFVGEIPKGMCICHSCDVPTCCNTTHLFIGSQKDNMRDCKNKGRNHIPIGETHGRAVITDTQAVSIKRLISSGKRLVDISREEKIPLHVVKSINLGRTWRSV